jgi:hypothetical protein
MKEKSQKDDMRAALRGDLERARERRGSTLLDREPEPVVEEPEPEPVLEEPEPEPAEVPDTPPVEAPEVSARVSDTPEAPEPPEPASDPPEPKRRRLLWFLRD